MKKIIIFALSAFLLLGSGIAIGSSINGDYKGNPIVLVKSSNKTLTDEVPAQIIDGKTMVPLTMLRQFGFDVTWNASNYSVIVEPIRPKLSKDEILKMKNGIGIVYCYDSSGNPAFQGTGFVIDNDLLLTAYHVSQGCSKLSFGSIEFTKGDIGNHDLDYFGVRLNKIRGHENDKFDSLNYSAKMPQDKEKVYALGYPNNNFAITNGLTQINSNLPEQMIKHSAITRPGSSGGILVNEYGEVLGITIRGDETADYNIAVPMMYVQRELDKLK